MSSLIILFFIVLVAVAVESCMLGHNYIDKGKYFACTKCGRAIVKKKKT